MKETEYGGTGDRVWLRQGNRGTGSMSNRGQGHGRGRLRQGNRGTSLMSNRGQGHGRGRLRQGNRGTEESNRGRSFSHRITQKNRTHKAAQRH